MKIKLLIPVVGLILLTILFLFINQGGLESVVITKKESKKRFLIGKMYSGNIKNEKFGQMFQTIIELKNNKNLKGDLATIYYNNPENSKGNIKAFFGVFINDSTFSKDSFEILCIQPQIYLEGKINASSAFVGKTYNAIFDYAKKNNIKLEDEYIEWFPSANEIYVQIKIKNE